MNKNLTLHLGSKAPDIGKYIIALHGNSIIKCDGVGIFVCNGNYQLTLATKKALIECLGGSFKGSTYFVNGKAIELSNNWQSITGELS